MENNKQGKYRIWGTLGGFLILHIALFILFIYPIIRGIMYNSDEIQKKRIDNEINQNGIDRIPDMEKIHNLFTQKNPEFNVIIDPGTQLDFLKQLENLAQETNNEISYTIDNKPKIDKDSILGRLPLNGNFFLIEASLTGDYENFYKFIYRLENFEKYVTVISFNFSKETIENAQKAETRTDIFNPSQQNQKKVPAQNKEVLKSLIRFVVYSK